MTDEVWKRDEIESPCVKVCMIHPKANICIGCHRTEAEIRHWSRMTPKERREIMDGLEARNALIRATRKGGRASRLGEPDSGRRS